MNYQEILDFWFDSKSQMYWFTQNDAFDAQIEARFKGVHHQAAQAELWSWRGNAEERLAEIIVLDQLSRNLYRNSALAFAQDGLALALAQEAITRHLDAALPATQRRFLYMPFMHSESKQMHQYALKWFENLADPISLDFEKRHQVIIERFGRYPHRNHVLGRQSTAEELDFLTQPNSHF